MPRELTWPEAVTFLGRHKEVFDQVTMAERGGYIALPLVYPGYGVAVRDSVFTYVLVWRDAGKKWHYIDLTSMPDFAAEVNRPEYVSPGGSFLQSLGYGLQESASQITTILKWTVVAALAIVVVSQAVRLGR